MENPSNAFDNKELEELTIAPHPGGRPQVIDEIVIAKLLVMLQRGFSIRKACEYAQISQATFYRRMKSDSEFCEHITRARNYLQTLASENIAELLLDKSSKNLTLKIRLSMWILERKDPAAFGTPEERLYYQNKDPEQEQQRASTEPDIQEGETVGSEESSSAYAIDYGKLVTYPYPELKPYEPVELKVLPPYKVSPL